MGKTPIKYMYQLDRLNINNINLNIFYMRVQQIFFLKIDKAFDFRHCKLPILFCVRAVSCCTKQELLKQRALCVRAMEWNSCYIIQDSLKLLCVCAIVCVPVLYVCLRLIIYKQFDYVIVA